jgi:hypothetical protein
MANYNSVDFKIGRLCGVLTRGENEDFWNLDEFVYLLNEHKGDLIISTELLVELLGYYCGEINIINYRNREVFVLGCVMGIVYYCETDKTVKMLDYDEYDEDEIEEILNKE